MIKSNLRIYFSDLASPDSNLLRFLENSKREGERGRERGEWSGVEGGKRERFIGIGSERSLFSGWWFLAIEVGKSGGVFIKCIGGEFFDEVLTHVVIGSSFFFCGGELIPVAFDAPVNGDFENTWFIRDYGAD